MNLKLLPLGLLLLVHPMKSIAQTDACDDHSFWNYNLPVEERIDNLIDQLTLEEKVSMMMNRSLAIPRLSIPAYNWWGEACHGLMGVSDVTVFPQAIALASTFDDDGQLATYSMVSDEARGRYNSISRDGDIGPYVSWIPNLTFWAPNVNLIRDPRWGRAQESYGEDPYLLSRMGVNVVIGMQGTDTLHYKTHACAKHYAVHSGPEPLRHQFNAVVSKRDLWESYLPAFKALVVEGNVQEVMCAYSALDGEPCCSSGRLLIDILRDRWNYKGIILTDCDAINDLYSKGRHETHQGPKDASADAVLHGTDLECGKCYNSLIDAVKEGLIKESDLDVSLRRVLYGRFTLGLLDPDEVSPYYNIPGSVVDCQRHRDHALKMAQESQLLLKNANNTLPLSKNIKTIAVVGPNIDDPIMMRGNYSGTPTHCVTILQGIQNKLPNAKIISNKACEIEHDYLQIPQGQNIKADGSVGFKAEYFGNRAFEGDPIVVTHCESIDYHTEGGYGFGNGVPTHDFSARYTAKYTPDFTGKLMLEIRGTEFEVKVNGETVGEFRPAKLSFEFKPGMELTEAQRQELMMSFFRRPKPVVADVVLGETYDIEILYTSAQEGTVSRLSVSPFVQKQLDFAELKESIKDAEAIIYVGGITPSQEGEGHERTTIELPEVQQKFLAEMRSTGKPVLYVNCSGSVIAFEGVDDNCDALLQAWYAGQEGGTAVADVLFGDYNPSAKSPLTFYKSTSQLPDIKDYNMENRTYRYFRGVPQYAFGYGLSYTTFEFGNAKLSKKSIKKGESVDIVIPVKNTGKMDGAEVVQVYVKSLTNPDAPIKALKAYKRVELAKGNSENVKLTLTPDAFSYYSEAKDDLDVFAGKYQILYGNSSRDEDLTAIPFEVK